MIQIKTKVFSFSGQNSNATLIKAMKTYFINIYNQKKKKHWSGKLISFLQSIV